MDELAYGIGPGGFRLPGATRLGAVRLQVADLDTSIAYYRAVIGLELLSTAGRGAALGAHGSTDVLVELHERPGANPVPRSGRLGLYHFAILLPDRASLGRFVHHLGTLGVRAGASDHLVSEALYLHDPDGLGIEVYADRPRASWQHTGRQLVMASEPLDLDDVARAAQDVPWSGMPEGTVIGHVHLHVGALEPASVFYHDGLGFDRMVWSYPGALFLAAGGYHHHLGLNTWAAHAPVAGAEDARLLEWDVLVDTIDTAHAALDSIARQGFAVTHTTDGGTATDPWGTTLRIAAIIGGA